MDNGKDKGKDKGIDKDLIRGTVIGGERAADGRGKHGLHCTQRPVISSPDDTCGKPRLARQLKMQ